MEKAIDKVGLEAEFLLQDNRGNFVLPATRGIATDEFPLLGEVRGEPGTTPSDAWCNFIKKWHEVVQEVKEDDDKLTLITTDHFVVLSADEYTKILSSMGQKSVNKCRNVYGDNILKMSDTISNAKGIATGQKISTGLHIHFSSSVKNKIKVKIPNLQPLRLPLGIKSAVTEIILYTKQGSTKKKVVSSVNRITKPDVEYIVRRLDRELFSKYVSSGNLKTASKFRRPGWYEVKSHGFEYRSLPFCAETLRDLLSITEYAFKLLGDLDIE